MRDLDDLFAALAKSAFRRRQQLDSSDRAYLVEHGLATILDHARKFISERLGPPCPANDGKQTPWRGHPAFVAQHATATCCRGCLSKWHRIDQGCALTDVELDYILTVLSRWLESQVPRESLRGQPRLFDDA